MNPWTPENAVAAFNAALTRSAHDRAFRDRLTSPESAKQAVSEEGNVDIPQDVVIVFHEGRYNEKYHVFWLPAFNQQTQAAHTYQYHFKCCYNAWLQDKPPTHE
jgi:hypothetical protein